MVPVVTGKSCKSLIKTKDSILDKHRLHFGIFNLSKNTFPMERKKKKKELFFGKYYRFSFFVVVVCLL